MLRFLFNKCHPELDSGSYHNEFRITLQRRLVRQYGMIILNPYAEYVILVQDKFYQDQLT